MDGVWTERPGDVHIALRETLLARHTILPAPAVPTIAARAGEFPDAVQGEILAALRSDGLVVAQLDEPLSNDRFLRLGELLGAAMPETDPDVMPYVQHDVILELVSRFGRTDDVARQPFATNYLALHSESSARALASQPAYIVLMCSEPGDAATAARTVLVPMDAVAGRLAEDDLAILGHTSYRNGPEPPPLCRQVGSRRVFSFRDFLAGRLAWSCRAQASDEAAVNDAIARLLAAMYHPSGASSVEWARGMVVIIDNTSYFHGKTAGAESSTGSPRHLKRLRILDGDAARRPLFAVTPTTRRLVLPRAAYDEAARLGQRAVPDTMFAPFVDDRLLELYARARDPTNPLELRDLWIGRMEHELGPHAVWPRHAERWRSTKPLREIDAEEVLSSRATVGLVKELFNWFFRDELYGELRSDDHTILSSGSVDEEAWGLPDALKSCVHYALDRDWYGYSDPRGRVPAREAVAAYESVRIRDVIYDGDHVALTMGGTAAMSSLADFLLLGTTSAAPALCAIPNYPPLVESIARRHPVRLVPLGVQSGRTTLAPLIAALTPDTPFVMLQTVSNPTGAVVDEAELGELIRAAAPSTMVLLDECHEWLGPYAPCSPRRAAANVVRVSSLSKVWSAPGLKVGWIVADPRFIAEYYEYASTTFGGPPSFLATLVEMLARMERWRLQEIEPGPTELSELDGGYGLTASRLLGAYRSYVADWTLRDQSLKTLRDAGVSGFSRVARVVPPAYSINIALELDAWDDSYRCFRDVLRQTGVAVFPGILTFCLSGGVVRVTTARPWRDLRTAIASIEQLQA